MKCDNLTINQILHQYKVGTEVYKKGPAPPIDSAKLGPIRNLSFTSPVLKAENLIKKKQ